MPHVIARAPTVKRVVVVGAGPGGLEAARVCAERGHSVILFEAAERLGGQIVLAANAGWRRDMASIVDWYERELSHLGVEVRRGVLAEADIVLGEHPDVIIVATGGTPLMHFPEGGGELAVSSWDVLSGQANISGRVLVYDETGEHSGLSTAQFIASLAENTELVTPDRVAGQAVGGLNYPVHLRELYRRGVKLTPDLRLMGARREGNALKVSLRNMYSREVEERTVDWLVANLGTEPVDQLFCELQASSVNHGTYDIDAMADGELRIETANAAGTFLLFRVGDAVASRNIHAAIYDALRICKDL